LAPRATTHTVVRAQPEADEEEASDSDHKPGARRRRAPGRHFYFLAFFFATFFFATFFFATFFLAFFTGISFPPFRLGLQGP
jgi:hypothetical protein